MGRTLYHKLRTMLEGMKGQVLNLDALRSLIIMNIGADTRTITQALRVMAETNLIEDINNSRFKVL